MSLPEQIGRWMSLREPQRISLRRLHAIAGAVDFKTAKLDAVAEAAVARCGIEKIEFDTEFPSFCFALATSDSPLSRQPSRYRLQKFPRPFTRLSMPSGVFGRGTRGSKMFSHSSGMSWPLCATAPSSL